MNLQEFIDYKMQCPLCKNALVIGFISKRKQKIRFEEDRMLVYLEMNSLNKWDKDYQVAYSFGLNDNSLCIEICNSQGEKYNTASPLFLIDRFRELHDNLKFYRFFRGCSFCRQYSYGTQNFDIDLPTSTYGSLQVWTEEVSVVHVPNDITSLIETQTSSTIYRCISIYGEDKSFVYIWKGSMQDGVLDFPAPYTADVLTLPLLIFPEEDKFQDKLLSRLKTLHLFS